MVFRGGDKDHRLILQNNKICLPAALQKKTVDWYHEMLCHLGETRTEHTLHQHLTGKAFTQQSTTCVRSAEQAKEPKKLIKNMASCHPNSMKPIPGTLYV